MSQNVPGSDWGPPASPLLHCFVQGFFLPFSQQNYHLALIPHLFGHWWHSYLCGICGYGAGKKRLPKDHCTKYFLESCAASFRHVCQVGWGERACIFSLLPSILWIIYFLISFFAFTLSNYGVSLCRRLVIGKLVYKSGNFFFPNFFPLSHRKERQRYEKE